MYAIARVGGSANHTKEQFCKTYKCFRIYKRKIKKKTISMRKMMKTCKKKLNRNT